MMSDNDENTNYSFTQSDSILLESGLNYLYYDSLMKIDELLDNHFKDV